MIATHAFSERVELQRPDLPNRMAGCNIQLVPVAAMVFAAHSFCHP